MDLALPAALGIVFLYVLSGLKVFKEYERGVLFVLGRSWGAKGPGLRFLPPLLTKVQTVSLRVVAMDIPPQDVITRDNISIKVNAVLYMRVGDPAALPANGHGDRVGEQLDDHLPAAARTVQGILRERDQAARRAGTAGEDVWRPAPGAAAQDGIRRLAMAGELISREALERIIQRAAELQAGEHDIGDGLTETELLSLGQDVGIPARHLRQAPIGRTPCRGRG